MKPDMFVVAHHKILSVLANIKFFQNKLQIFNFLSFFFKQILVWRFAGRRIEIDFNSLPISTF
jgi:hypothetical protein